ncbi:hypothetical protein EPI10_015937 [Gossypium australe]|uniref:Tf2-1-like SH3-like domain-containing protein n=1 Tax=Gossypium australe TaxID=47621 RepID=A0A5B6VLQ3_9ROSI|nr:hypothetical protein EPI10_015937 [Gossypium australe]
MSLDMVTETENKVRLTRGRLKAASDRQKSYENIKRKDIEFVVEDQVFLKVSPWKKVLKFGRPVAYQLELPLDLDSIHDVFHISMLRQYQSDPSHIVPFEEIEVRPYLTFEEESVQIMDREVKVLRRKAIPLVKVLWWNHGTEEATWN